MRFYPVYPTNYAIVGNVFPDAITPNTHLYPLILLRIMSAHAENQVTQNNQHINIWNYHVVLIYFSMERYKILNELQVSNILYGFTALIDII